MSSLEARKEIPTTETERKELIEKLVSDQKLFNDFVYTSLEDAMSELEERKKDTNLKKIVDSVLPQGIPDIMLIDKCAVLHRQVVTPNYEVRRFVSVVDALELNPVFFGYSQDKFVTESDWKYSLGSLTFYIGTGKKGGVKSERLNVVNFNSANGKKISELTTLWGESLIDFHHGLFRERFPIFKDSIFDGSDWYAENGQKAKDYYGPFLLLFIRNGILFENFMIDVKELSFTKEVFLPAFIKAIELTGKKPLIVALEPTDIEGDNFWLCHPHDSIHAIKEKLNLLK